MPNYYVPRTDHLARGISEGIDSYLTQKNLQDQKAFERQKLDAELASRGLIKTDEGLIQKSPELEEREKGEYKYKTEAEPMSRGVVPKFDEEGKITGYEYAPEFFKMKAENDPLKMALAAQTMELHKQQMVKNKYDIEQAQYRQAEEARKKTPQGKIESLGASEKQRFDNITAGLQSVKDMRNALKAGENTFSLVGDNPYTQANTQFSEAIGRMQSGGAINDEEAKRFLQMAPTFKDSEEMKAYKLNKIEEMLNNRAKTFGIKPEDLESMGYVKQPTAYKKKGLLEQVGGLFGFGKKSSDPGKQVDLGTSKAVAAPSDQTINTNIKTVGGERFVKVKGGWQKIKTQKASNK